MKRGTIVINNKTNRIGMIVWKKNNQEIGVNFSHFGIINRDDKVADKLKALRCLGVDGIYSKEELTIHNEVQ